MVLTPKNQRVPQWREPQYWKTFGSADSSRDMNSSYVMPGTAVYQPKNSNGRNVLEMPGSKVGMNTASGMAEQWADLPIWFRMGALVRSRRIDIVEIMHGFDPKDANIFEQTVFSRALADCFGKGWAELAMTEQEYLEITEPYLTRKPTGPGQPPALIMYRNFATDLQNVAEQQLCDDDVRFAMSLRGKATITPLNQKGPKMN